MSARLTADVPVIPGLLPHLTPSALHLPLLFGSGNIYHRALQPPWAWPDITATLFHTPEAIAELKLGEGLEWEKHTCHNSDTQRFCGATTITFVSHLNPSLSQSHHCLPFSSHHCWALPPLTCNLWSFLSVSCFSYLTHFCTLSHSQFLGLSCTINQFWITHLLLLSVLHFLPATEDAVNFLPSLALSSSILCLIESDAICILRGHWDIQ